MTQWLPVPMRKSVEKLWDDIQGTFERWVPRKRDKQEVESTIYPTSLFQIGSGPAIDLIEKEDEIVVSAELPGLSAKDFTVDVSGRRLRISGRKEARREEKKKNYYYKECHFGSFSRSVALPCEVQSERSEARLKNGILEIHLPKTEEAKTKRIKIPLS